MRMTGSSESRAILVASSTPPFSNAARSCSIFCGSRRWLSRHHQNVRSPTTATATRAQMRIGHMTGPPLRKNATTIFASISVYDVLDVWLCLVRAQHVCDAGLKLPSAGARWKRPVSFDVFHRAVIQNREARGFFHVYRQDISCFIGAHQQGHRPLFPLLQGDLGVRRLWS